MQNNMAFHNLAKTPKLFFFNWYVIVPALAAVVHLRPWTFGIFAFFAGLSWCLEFFGYTPMMFLRKLRFGFSFSPDKRIRTKRRIKYVSD
jgi:hypothetical protein